MSLQAVLGRARLAAVALMTDECALTRPGARGAFNASTGSYDPADAGVLYAGACRVKTKDLSDRVVQAGEQPVSLWPYMVWLPISVTDVQVDDLVTVTGSEFDAGLVGLVLRVRQVTFASQVSSRRLGCEVNAG
jgi:hypothetical protein